MTVQHCTGNNHLDDKCRLVPLAREAIHTNMYGCNNTIEVQVIVRSETVKRVTAPSLPFVWF